MFPLPVKILVGSLKHAYNAILKSWDGALWQIDYVHGRIHAEDHFYYSEIQTAIATGTSVDYVLTTPASPKVHLNKLLFSGSNNGVHNIEIWEAGDRVPTTLLTMLNNERNSAQTFGGTLHRGFAGGTTDGTKIFDAQDGTGGAFGTTGTINKETELVLKISTQYIIKVVNNSGGNSDLNTILEVYED